MQAVKRIYADILRSDGTKIFPGFPKGSESNWHLMAAGYLGSGGQVEFAESLYRYFVFQDPDWDYATMDLERDVAYADRHVGELLNSNDPDLRPFRDRGGKLIQYHGWADWGITPYNSIDYFNAVAETVGGSMSEEARRDVQEFLDLAAAIPIKPELQEYGLQDANQALMELKNRKIRGAKVLRVE